MHHLLLLLLLGNLSFRSYATEPGLSENIKPGSEIFASKSPSSWTSPSGRFAFGFFPEGRGFRVGIWLQTSPNRTVVWVANRDDGLVSGDAKLLVSRNDARLLLLVDGQVWSKLISDQPEDATSASFRDTGNLVIFNSLSKIIWQSFDFPTDTIVANQALLIGHQLVSGVSERNRSSGSFRLTYQTDGNLVAYPREYRDSSENAYWATGFTTVQGINKLLLAGDGLLSLLNGKGEFLYNLTGVQSSDPKFTYRATLDADGIFRLYSHNFSRNGTSVVVGKWPSADDPCYVKGICGYNSFCSSIHDQRACSCISSFSFVDPNDWTRGCEPNRCGVSSSPSVNESILVMDSVQVEWFDDFYSAPPASTRNECADSCLADRNCEAAFFGSGTCRKQRMPLKNGKIVKNSSYLTLIKARSCNSSVEVTGSSSSRTSKAERRLVFPIFVGGALIAVAAVALGVASLLFYRSRRRSYTRLSRKGNLGLTEEVSLPMFSYDELRIATDGFKEELGRGAFGAVYKGITTDQKLVAVKRLEKVIEEGEREFLTEMISIGRTHHRNLVRLLGVCHEGQTRLLVYEYMSNGSLASFIFNDDQVLPRPHWNDRVRVAVDVARGIHYLHEDCDPHIIHCDIKPQNILMDASWTAKISDFGLAKLLTPDQTRTFTGVRGTRGYLAPEWYKNLPISVKADVYSFGMVLLETVCCRRNVDIDVPHEEMILTEWVYRCFRHGELLKLVKTGEVVEKRMLERMVMVGLWCIQEEPALRPTMKMVMSMLEGNLEIPTPPAPDSRN